MEPTRVKVRRKKVTGNDVKTLICRLALAGEHETLARYKKLSRSEKRAYLRSYQANLDGVPGYWWTPLNREHQKFVHTSNTLWPPR